MVRQGSALPAGPGWEMCQGRLKPGKRSPVAHAKGPCSKLAIFPRAVGEQTAPNAPQATPKLHPQADAPGRWILRARPQKAQRLGQRRGSGEHGEASALGGTRGPSCPASRRRLGSLPGRDLRRRSPPRAPPAPSLPLPPLIDTFLVPRLFWSVTMAIPCLNRVLVNLFTIPIITFSNPG